MNNPHYYIPLTLRKLITWTVIAALISQPTIAIAGIKSGAISFVNTGLTYGVNDGSPVTHVFSVPYAEVSANECGPRYSMFKKIFSATKVQRRWIAIFKAEVLDGYHAAIRPVKGRTQARSSRSKLVRLVDVELPQAISIDGGLKDIVSCWYSLNYEGTSTTELEQLLRFDIDGVGFGTQTIGWLAGDWCEKRFWPRFIEKHHSSLASYESRVEFRPLFWCGGNS